MDKNYVTYEYMTKVTKKGVQGQLVDIYEAFGWEATDSNVDLSSNIIVSFKRERKLLSKQELNRLQRNAEDVIHLIAQLEKRKTTKAFIFALIFGITGSLIFGGGMSMTLLLTSSVLPMVGGIILGIIGILFCSINYPIYKKQVSKNVHNLTPIIDENLEKLANICENANELLAKSSTI